MAATDRARDGLDAAVIPERVMVAMTPRLRGDPTGRESLAVSARWYACMSKRHANARVESPR
jgi:hypothetical protein